MATPVLAGNGNLLSDGQLEAIWGGEEEELEIEGNALAVGGLNSAAAGESQAASTHGTNVNAEFEYEGEVKIKDNDFVKANNQSLASGDDLTVADNESIAADGDAVAGLSGAAANDGSTAVNVGTVDIEDIAVVLGEDGNAASGESTITVVEAEKGANAIGGDGSIVDVEVEEVDLYIQAMKDAFNESNGINLGAAWYSQVASQSNVSAIKSTCSFFGIYVGQKNYASFGGGHHGRRPRQVSAE
jgi:hypothetical protein